MQMKSKEYDVGVIVGRFQVHDLHEGHVDLIQSVLDEHEKVIVFLGLSPLMNTKNNPLDFEARKQMILEAFPEVNVLYVKDLCQDDVWSKKLDGQILDLITPSQSVVLYGGRDSFIDHYTGRFDTRELVPNDATFFSGSKVRKDIARASTKGSPDFRAGVVWASASRFPTAYTTVDVAVLDHDRILLGRKPNEDKYRIFGGFSDPESESFEADAKREVREECGLEVGDLRYIGSYRVDDWRYRHEADCIKTMLFTAKYLHGHPRPDDDIEEVRWFPFDANSPADHEIMPAHRPLMAMLRANLLKEDS
jgi:bifunctional NMN adenylyltransferase/nudix hydrolase